MYRYSQIVCRLLIGRSLQEEHFILNFSVEEFRGIL